MHIRKVGRFKLYILIQQVEAHPQIQSILPLQLKGILNQDINLTRNA